MDQLWLGTLPCDPDDTRCQVGGQDAAATPAGAGGGARQPGSCPGPRAACCRPPSPLPHARGMGEASMPLPFFPQVCVASSAAAAFSNGPGERVLSNDHEPPNEQRHAADDLPAPAPSAAAAEGKSSYFEEHVQKRAGGVFLPQPPSVERRAAATATGEVSAASPNVAYAPQQGAAQPVQAVQTGLAGAGSIGSSSPMSRGPSRASSNASGPILALVNGRHVGPTQSEEEMAPQDHQGANRAGQQGSKREAGMPDSTRAGASASASATAAMSGAVTVQDADARDSPPSAEPEPVEGPRATRSARKRGKEAATDHPAVSERGTQPDTCDARTAHGDQQAAMDLDDSSSGDEIAISIFLPSDLPIVNPKKKRLKSAVPGGQAGQVGGVGSKDGGSDVLKAVSAAAALRPVSDEAWNASFHALDCWLKHNGHPHPGSRYPCCLLHFFFSVTRVGAHRKHAVNAANVPMCQSASCSNLIIAPLICTLPPPPPPTHPYTHTRICTRITALVRALRRTHTDTNRRAHKQKCTRTQSASSHPLI